MSFNPNELTLVEDQANCDTEDMKEIVSQFTDAENTWYNDLLSEEKKHDPIMDDLNINIMNLLFNGVS